LKRARGWRKLRTAQGQKGIGPLSQIWRIWRTNKLAGAVLALALAACSLDSGLFSKSDSKSDATFDLHQGPKGDAKQRVVTANDLIDASGRCAGEAGPAAPQALNFTTGPQTGPAPTAPPPEASGAPPARTGVALGMTECEVVRVLGHTDRIEIATNERGQRSVTLTYLTGERSGIYRFVAGQLVSLERTGEAPAPKPAKPKPKAAKKQPPG
jgi:hypothetical protein